MLQVWLKHVSRTDFESTGAATHTLFSRVSIELQRLVGLYTLVEELLARDVPSVLHSGNTAILLKHTQQLDLEDLTCPGQVPSRDI